MYLSKCGQYGHVRKEVYGVLLTKPAQCSHCDSCQRHSLEACKGKGPAQGIAVAVHGRSSGSASSAETGLFEKKTGGGLASHCEGSVDSR